MEDTLGALFLSVGYLYGLVLILVLMEDTLGETRTELKSLRGSLNPCSNGRYSRSLQLWRQQKEITSLNPCSNGRYSRSGKITTSI